MMILTFKVFILMEVDESVERQSEGLFKGLLLAVQTAESCAGLQLGLVSWGL